MKALLWPGVVRFPKLLWRILGSLPQWPAGEAVPSTAAQPRCCDVFTACLAKCTGHGSGVHASWAAPNAVGPRFVRQILMILPF